MDVWAEQQGLKPGDSLAHYTVTEVLGHGGMGTVYAARDEKLGRTVALKVLHSSIGELRDAPAMLMHEARTLARLSHPNIVSVFDVDASGEHLFLVMERVLGSTLDEWLADDWRTTAEVLEVFIPAGRGLAAAHEAGIVHGDFKPSNVLIGDDGRVRVVDFGVARIGPELEHPAGPDRFRLEDLSGRSASDLRTTSELLMGTPAFMAPEQLSDNTQDSRSDQFSFCVALYTAIFGSPPFEGETLENLAENVIQGRLRDAPAKSRQERRLAQILGRGMNARPERRYPSMSALLDRLERRPRRRAVMLAALAVAVAAAGGGLTLALGSGASRPCEGSARQLAGIWDAPTRDRVRAGLEPLAGAPEAWAIIAPVLDRYAGSWAAMHRETCEATRVRRQQPEALLDLRMLCLQDKRQELIALRELFREPAPGQLPGLIAATQRLSDIAECGDIEALLAPIRPPADHQAREIERRLRDLAAGLRVLNRAGRYTETIEQSTPAIREARLHRLSRALGELLLERGAAQQHAGLHEEAEKTLMEAAEAAEAARDQPGKVRAWSQLIAVLGVEQVSDRWRRWEGLARASLSALDGAAGAEPRRRLVLAVGAAHAGNGEFEPALAQLRIAEQLARESGDDADLAMATGALGSTLYTSGGLEAARQTLERAIELRSRVFGASHPEVAEAINNLGLVHAGLGDLERAFELTREALALRERATPPNPAELAESYTNIGGLHFAAGEISEAEPWFRKAVDTEQAHLRPDHPSLAGSLYNLGMAYLGLERTGEARALFERAASIIETNSGYFSRSAMLFELARGLQEAGGDRARARRLAQAARAELVTQEPIDREAIAEIDAWIAE